MGQGSYVALVVGCVLTTAQARALRKIVRREQKSYDNGLGEMVKYTNETSRQDEIETDAHKAKVEPPRGGYECKADYLGYKIAATSGYMNRELDGFGAIPLHRFKAWAGKKYEKPIAKARRDWSAYRKLAARHGVKLPAPTLMLVADFD
jgi:hypothetical protein